MVDFGVFFIFLRMAAEYSLSQTFVTTERVLLAFGSLFALFLVLALIFKAIPATRNKKTPRTLAKISVFFFVVMVLTLISMAWPYIVEWQQGIFGLDGSVFGVIVGTTLLSLLALGFLIASRLAPTDPRNDSLMNTRQVTFVLGMTFIVALCLFLVFSLLFPTFTTFMIVLYVVITVLSFLFWLYDPLIYVLSKLFRERSKPQVEPTPSKLNRFAVIGCAHNEATVIDQLIKSVYNVAYPKNKYDVYVICDNCTDNTADIVRASGATAMERNDPDHRGKGFGLQWMFDFLDEKRKAGDEYDAYLILDADNLVNESFLEAVNDRLNEGHEILQCYLGCKNPLDTWVSASYSYAYWVSNTIYQNAHSDVGLSAQMGGTGMVIRPKVLDDIGWHTDSLAEDLVLTSRYILERNQPCKWVHDAKLYDEKPLKTIPSIRQRTRWMQGHMDAMRKYGLKLFIAGIKNLSIKQLDMAFYLVRPFLSLMLFIVYIAFVAYNVFVPASAVEVPIMMSAGTSYMLLVGMFLLQFYILFLEGHGRLIPVFVAQVFFSFTWFPAMFRGLVKRDELYWVSTVHARNMSNKDVKEDVILNEVKERLQDLDNLHSLPLGQILLKATAISKKQLDAALEEQQKNGGYLGDIVVNMNALSQDTLDAYLKIQQTMVEQAKAEGKSIEHLRLGDLLVNGGVLTQKQLDLALEYQSEHGGYLGDALVFTKCISFDLLGIFLEMQNLMDANHISPRNAQTFIQGCMDHRTENIGTILHEGGFVSRQQLDLALEIQQKTKSSLGEILVENGFINEETLKIILALQTIARDFELQQKAEEGGKTPGDTTSEPADDIIVEEIKESVDAIAHNSESLTAKAEEAVALTKAVEENVVAAEEFKKTVTEIAAKADGIEAGNVLETDDVEAEGVIAEAEEAEVLADIEGEIVEAEEAEALTEVEIIEADETDAIEEVAEEALAEEETVAADEADAIDEAAVATDAIATEEAVAEVETRKKSGTVSAADIAAANIVSLRDSEKLDADNSGQDTTNSKEEVDE